ncbi:hypothetical protein HW445_23320, partial [Streptomyces sp. UH6]|nr:hypothetical protein [Streptomyces sp. UH6]
MTITRTRPTVRPLGPGLRRALAHSLPALAVVFALLTTSGWTAAPEHPPS